MTVYPVEVCVCGGGVGEKFLEVRFQFFVELRVDMYDNYIKQSGPGSAEIHEGV